MSDWLTYVPERRPDGSFERALIGALWGAQQEAAAGLGFAPLRAPFSGNDHGYDPNRDGLREVEVRALPVAANWQLAPQVRGVLSGPNLETSFSGDSVPESDLALGTSRGLRHYSGTTWESKHQCFRFRVLVILDTWDVMTDMEREELLKEAFLAAVEVFRGRTKLL